MAHAVFPSARFGAAIRARQHRARARPRQWMARAHFRSHDSRGSCLLLTAFWALRLAAAAFIFDVRPYLTNWFYRAGYQAINVIFLYLLAVYVLAAWKGGSL